MDDFKIGIKTCSVFTGALSTMHNLHRLGLTDDIGELAAEVQKADIICSANCEVAGECLGDSVDSDSTGARKYLSLLNLVFTAGAQVGRACNAEEESS